MGIIIANNSKSQVRKTISFCSLQLVSDSLLAYSNFMLSQSLGYFFIISFVFLWHFWYFLVFSIFGIFLWDKIWQFQSALYAQILPRNCQYWEQPGSQNCRSNLENAYLCYPHDCDSQSLSSAVSFSNVAHLLQHPVLLCSSLPPYSSQFRHGSRI